VTKPNGMWLRAGRAVASPPGGRGKAGPVDVVVFGRYRLLPVIGKGATGKVYQAHPLDSTSSEGSSSSGRDAGRARASHESANNPRQETSKASASTLSQPAAKTASSECLTERKNMTTPPPTGVGGLR
jgi:hypothetical protein